MVACVQSTRNKTGCEFINENKKKKQIYQSQKTVETKTRDPEESWIEKTSIFMNHNHFQFCEFYYL